MDGAVEQVHATAVAVGNRAVLFRGPSGAGKSDLALRCLALPLSALLPYPARLVADDQVVLWRDGLTLAARAPDTLLGKLEVRGLGILEVDPERAGRIALVADLVAPGEVERLPDPWPVVNLLGLAVPVIRISAFECAAPLKILAALSMPALPPLAEWR